MLLIRELSASLVPCELTILVVTAAFWSGVSLGYWLSDRLTERHIGWTALAALAPQLALCVVRLWPLDGLRLGFRGWWVLAWLYLLVVPLPTLYSAILPRVARAPA